MGKVLIIPSANFSTNAIEQITISAIDAPIITNVDAVVTITSAYDVYYTTDGTTPSRASTLYSAPFSVHNGTVVKAIAYNDGEYSSITTKTIEAYTLISLSDLSLTTGKFLQTYATSQYALGAVRSMSSFRYTERVDCSSYASIGFFSGSAHTAVFYDSNGSPLRGVTTYSAGTVDDHDIIAELNADWTNTWYYLNIPSGAATISFNYGTSIGGTWQWKFIY